MSLSLQMMLIFSKSRMLSNHRKSPQTMRRLNSTDDLHCGPVGNTAAENKSIYSLKISAKKRIKTNKNRIVSTKLLV